MAKQFLVTGPSISYTGEFAKFSSSKRVGEKDGNKHGKRTGLSMTGYVDELLVANEKAKLGDGELQAELLAEFPNRKAVQAVSAYRGYFNGSKHGHNAAGKFTSTCHGRNTGEGALKPKRDASHPNVLANRGADYGQAKAKAKAAKGGKPAAKPAKGKAAAKPAAKVAKPKAAKPKAAKPAAAE